MPDATPVYDLPYPLGGEGANGPGAFKALADAVEAILVEVANPIFTDVTYASGWSDFSVAYEGVSYAKVLGRVYLRGAAKHGTTSTTGTVFTLPDGYRPTKARSWLVRANTGYSVCTITPDGLVSLGAYQGGGNAAIVSFDNISFDTAA